MSLVIIGYAQRLQLLVSEAASLPVVERKTHREVLKTEGLDRWHSTAPSPPNGWLFWNI